MENVVVQRSCVCPSHNPKLSLLSFQLRMQCVPALRIFQKISLQAIYMINAGNYTSQGEEQDPAHNSICT